MIIDKILEFFCEPIKTMVSNLPSFRFTINTEYLDIISELLKGVNYLAPLGLLTTIISIKLSLRVIKALLSIIIRVKSFIPTMGA